MSKRPFNPFSNTPEKSISDQIIESFYIGLVLDNNQPVVYFKYKIGDKNFTSPLSDFPAHILSIRDVDHQSALKEVFERSLTQSLSGTWEETYEIWNRNAMNNFDHRLMTSYGYPIRTKELFLAELEITSSEKTPYFFILDLESGRYIPVDLCRIVMSHCQHPKNEEDELFLRRLNEVLDLETLKIIASEGN